VGVPPDLPGLATSVFDGGSVGATNFGGCEALGNIG
jgi:hypothetical protein